ncbi:hypothetical protein EIP91_001852 [Steccherinum ochraceum]|uniref:Cytochrome P450 n=1 Tax=Steccherinum ochraceum TaxID=92696 RepID=A0A4R0RU10_9APHY|nr:hypothetical protein EIP91_001852 [Steccherinum ochraceum]
MSINSYEAAVNLLDKRGAIYSDRPRMPMIKELLGWSWNLVVMSYSEGFAAHRKLIQQRLSATVVAKEYRPVMYRETKVLLRNLLSSPDEYLHHLKSMTGAIVMMITYGHSVAPEGDEYIKLAENVRETGGGAHGSVLIDFLPWLQYVPAWFPGAGFKRHAEYARSLHLTMRSEPYEEVKQLMAAGTAAPSLVSNLIEDNHTENNPEIEDFIKNIGGVIYSAGADTSVTVLTDFVLAMMRNPHVQARAQKELDEVVGHSRLPEFSDRTDLPYISGIVKESLRWRAVAPLGVVHSVTENDEYRGMFIPKSTAVLPNLNAMLHDSERVYPNHDDFDPTRHIVEGSKDAAPDPARAVFGFGRWICPGRFFQENDGHSGRLSAVHPRPQAPGSWELLGPGDTDKAGPVVCRLLRPFDGEIRYEQESEC